ncbi:MAG: hypothetical protein AUJ56_11420 [Zetaproteobacteria bacterium CG1_02_49_23]|nr:MAG: hypothetical protein AUJ56_11420 [Zetaproteobacteria bacterium CG1_02_49_23]
MLRLVADEEGIIWPDFMQQAPGRGAYLCMQDDCLKVLNDKKLAALKRKWHVVLPQWQLLKSKILQQLLATMSQQLQQSKVITKIGRDAVMQDLWKNGPRVIFLVHEAGQALVRQVTDAVHKRSEAGQMTTILTGLPENLLAEVYQREKVSVVCMPDSARAEKLKLFFAWYERLKEAK